MIIECLILSTRLQCRLGIELVFNSHSHSFHASTCQCYNQICFLKDIQSWSFWIFNQERDRKIKWLLKSNKLHQYIGETVLFVYPALFLHSYCAIFIHFLKKPIIETLFLDLSVMSRFDVTNDNITCQTIPIIGQIRFNNFWSVSKQVLST